MSIYSNVKNGDQASDTYSNACKKKTLYFSDGTLEVDEVEEEPSAELYSKSVPVNPQDLTWIPWMWYYTLTAGSKALEVCDYLGESLASFFGITTPKYQFELNEYYRMKKEEEAQNEIEMGEWAGKFGTGEVNNGTISTEPKTIVRSNEGKTLSPGKVILYTVPYSWYNCGAPWLLLMTPLQIASSTKPSVPTCSHYLTSPSHQYEYTVHLQTHASSFSSCPIRTDLFPQWGWKGKRGIKIFYRETPTDMP